MQVVYGEQETIEQPVPEELRSRQALSDAQILGLAEIGRKIEEHYGQPMDVEWALCGGRLYILQARPITTLEARDEVSKYIEGIRLSKAEKKTMAFMLEKTPFAYRPLDFDYIDCIDAQKTRIFRELGLETSGEIVMDEDGIQTLPRPHRGLNRNIFHLAKSLRSLRDFDACAEACRKFMPRYEAELRLIAGLKFETTKDCADFLAHSLELLRDLAYDRFRYALFPSVLCSRSMTRLIRKINPDYEAFDFYRGLNNKTAVVTADLARMAAELRTDPGFRCEGSYDELAGQFPRFKALAAEFLANHGYKSDFNCYCLTAKTFHEDPDRLVQILRPLLEADTPQPGRSTEQEYTALISTLREKSGRRFSAHLRRIDAFRFFHVVREETQYLWEALFYHVRRCLRRANSLLLGDEDYIHGLGNLFHAELVPALRRGLLSEEDREKIRRRDAKHPLAKRVWEACKCLVFEPAGDVLRGVSGSPGLAVGRACVVSGPEEFYKLQAGDVLVCHLTDPEWTPLFHLAAAVVSDTGSSLSHAAIVAREFGIPAVLGVGYATTCFPDGARVQVDGNRGEARLC